MGDDLRTQRRPQLDASSFTRILVAVFAVLVVVVVVGLSQFELEIGKDEEVRSYEVDLSNECDSPVVAQGGGSERTVRDELAARPVMIPSGDRGIVALGTHVVDEQPHLFLAYAVGDGPVVVLQLDTDDLDVSPTRLVVGTNCAIEVAAAP